MPITNRYAAAKRATIISATTNCLLAIFKIWVGYLGNSHALVVDGIHSFSDLVSDALVLFAAKAGGRMPDKEHPYGHQRIETIAAISIAIILLGVGIGIIVHMIRHVLGQTPPPLHGLPTIVVAIIAIISYEGLYRYNKAVSKRIHSQLLLTNAYHNRSDSFTSIVVLISVTGSMLGIHNLDAIGAAIIALWIAKIAIQMLRTGISELIDTSADPNTVEKITQIIRNVPGVTAVHQLRTRLHGGSIFVDVHLIVNPFISVSEGHHIGEQVNLQLIKQDDRIADVTVHIDPEDDLIQKPSLNLPPRPQLIEKLRPCWEMLPGYSSIQKINLHYLNGRLQIEIFMPESAVSYSEKLTLARLYQQAAKIIPEIATLEIYFLAIPSQPQGKEE